jgi:hypothetical protein
MRAATTFRVPAGTRESTCRGCDASIYWIVNANDKKVPIDCDADGCFPPTAREEGLGVSHFPTCPDANRFSGRNRG